MARPTRHPPKQPHIFSCFPQPHVSRSHLRLRITRSCCPTYWRCNRRKRSTERATKRTFATIKRAGARPDDSARSTSSWGGKASPSMACTWSQALRRSAVARHADSRCSKEQRAEPHKAHAGWLAPTCRAALPSPQGWCPHLARPHSRVSSGSVLNPSILLSICGKG